MHSLIDYSTTDTLALIGLARAPVGVHDGLTSPNARLSM